MTNPEKITEFQGYNTGQTWYHSSMGTIILASSSPRRKNFFTLLGLPFTCIPAMLDETPPPGLPPRQAAEELAQKKALSVAERMVLLEPGIRWVFGADTIVVLDNEILGKPVDRNDAKQMLTRLEGRRHEVITAMALHSRQVNKTDCRSVSCYVDFIPMDENKIEWYLDTGEWEGAAGAYRLQEIGGCLIQSINGSPSAVAGLPLHEFYAMLTDNGYRFGSGRRP